jgi:hypothetical protein
MVLTISVVNTHAISHLFDDDISSVEECETCDEFIVSHSNGVEFISPSLSSDIQNSYGYLIITPSIIDISLTIILMPSGEYYNKPPPSFLV